MQDNFVSDRFPLISVIMPVYNVEKYLKNSIRSILEQKYHNIELICINDASKDNSLSILENIASCDDRVIIIDLKQNKGPANARNVGLNRARGKYISFVDSDDAIDPYIYVKLIEVAEKNNADLVIFGGTPFPNENDAPLWIKEKLSPPNVVYNGDNASIITLFYEKSSRPFLWLHFIKRDIIEKPFSVRLPDNLDLGEDQVFQFSYVPRAKCVAFISDKLYWYRYDNVGSIMWKYSKKRTEKFDKHLKVVEEVFSRWNRYGYEDKYGDLISWAVDFLYNLLSTFPRFLRRDFAKKFLDIVDRYPYPLFMCNEYVTDLATNIKKWASEEADFDTIFNEEVSRYRQEIEEKERVIKSLINSKSFKIGRLVTPKNKRSDINNFLPKPVSKD